MTAPCVAILGPPNSGKTTLLHLLDAALQSHPAEPLVYVVKGNPDGTGRYLFHVPEERENLKPLVKGKWTPRTPETIRRWVEEARRNLDLVLLDFGGKHDPVNKYMLECCSHFIVLAREFDDPAIEAGEGMDSWIEEANKAGLPMTNCIAKIKSLWLRGSPSISPGTGDIIEASFRADASRPGDRTNRGLIEALAAKLIGLIRPGDKPRYLDLRLRERRWEERDLPKLAGRLPLLVDRIETTGYLWLGGAAPIWVYAAAMHHGLNRNPELSVSVFDPKVPGGIVLIPARLDASGPGPVDAIRLDWDQRAGGTPVLAIRAMATDKIILLDALLTLPHLQVPEPKQPLDGQVVVIDGPAPIWLDLTLSRWVRGRGAKEIAHWDAAYKRPITVWPCT